MAIAQYGVWDPETEEDVAAGVSPTLKSFMNKGPIPTELKDGSKTLWEAFDKSVTRRKNAPCMGYRTVTKKNLMKSPDGTKVFEKLELTNEYSFRSYNEVRSRVERLASGMTKEMGLKANDKILIFAETQAGWMETALACWRQNVVVATAYATLGKDGVTAAVNQTKASVLICDAALFNVVQASAPECPSLQNVVTIKRKVDTMTVEDMEKALPGVKVRTLDQLIEKGKELVDPNPCDPNDVAVIMYTSGTTGNAKGVMITHQSIISSSRSSADLMTFLTPEAVVCAYLPLAHIMEMVTELSVLTIGGTLGYGSPGTLTDTGVKLAKGQKGDAPILRPTMFVFAPAVLDKVYNGVMDKIRGTGFKETLFNKALANGISNYDAGGVGANCCYNKIFQSSVQALVGGRVSNILTGSAPLSADIQKFVQTTFNAPTRQGYGLTETCAASCIAHHTDNEPNQVGGPTPGTLVRLRDWPEGNYRNSDLKDKAIGMRRGEVLIGGPTISKGYWIDESNPDQEVVKKNEEDWVVINGVRYFCSGDIGAVTSKGQVKIVDRKKDLFKGAAGEYVSLSKVEALLKLVPVVEMPMAYGKTGAKGIIALIVPKKAAIMKMAQENNLEVNDNYDELVKHKAIVDQVTKSVVSECKRGGLAGFEMPTAVAMCICPNGDPAWTPDNDNLTTTMKLKRPVIARNFQAQIEEGYARAA